MADVKVLLYMFTTLGCVFTSEILQRTKLKIQRVQCKKNISK